MPLPFNNSRDPTRSWLFAVQSSKTLTFKGTTRGRAWKSGGDRRPVHNRDEVGTNNRMQHNGDPFRVHASLWSCSGTTHHNQLVMKRVRRKEGNVEVFAKSDTMNSLRGGP